MEAVQAFLSVLDNKAIRPLSEDMLTWKGSTLGTFTVKAFYNILEGIPSISAPIEILWNHYIPAKVGFFAWEA